MPSSIRDNDKGFAELMGSLGEMGTITIGVQGAEANAKHPESSLTLGELAQMHELGTGGMPERSFIRSWLDKNSRRMVSEMAAAVKEVLARKTSRRKAMIEIGYGWVEEVRENIDHNHVTGPDLAASTVARKGHNTKLLGFTYALRNAITYKLFLPQKKSIRNTEQRAALQKEVK